MRQLPGWYEMTDFNGATPQVFVKRDDLAALIVRAVNAHDALVEACERVARILPYYHNTANCELPENCGHCVATKTLRAALALAKGKEQS